MTATQPYDFEGQTWAGEGRTLVDWAKVAGMSLRTLNYRLKKSPCIITEATGRPKRTLLRLGKPVVLDSPEAPERKARNFMAAIWREHLAARGSIPTPVAAGAARRWRRGPDAAEGEAGGTLRRPSPRRLKALSRRRKHPISGHDFGLICGLAKELPAGWQVKILQHTLSHWSAFCGVARGQLIYAEDALAHMGEGAADALFKGEALADHNLETARRLLKRREELRDKGKTLNVTSRFYFQHPDLGLMRLLPHVMLDLYVTDAQSAGRDWPGRIAFED